MPPTTKHEVAHLIGAALEIINPDEFTVEDVVVLTQSRDGAIPYDPPMIRFSIVATNPATGEEEATEINLTPIITFV